MDFPKPLHDSLAKHSSNKCQSACLDFYLSNKSDQAWFASKPLIVAKEFDILELAYILQAY